MTTEKTIEAEVVSNEKQPQTQALARVESGAVSTQRLTVDELKANLEYIRQVMQTVMKEGQDYGKIPGTGEKPCLLQPGAQKLCMTFQLQDRLKTEVLREYPGMHREYELTVTLVSATGREWDGVGTCSTLESKYRYRKAERRCPECGTNHIIQGKAEYGGGWICFKKKGGCGAKFVESDPRITSQPGGTVEYENPPDYWNTVRKMAFKRALVHAAINATNTSELWTQDIEDMSQNEPSKPSQASQPAQAPRPAQRPQAPAKPATAPAQAPATAQPAKAAPLKPATAATRKWMLDTFKDALPLLTEYLQAIAWLLPTEPLETLELRYVPNTRTKMLLLKDKVTAFGNGEEPSRPYPPDDIAQAAAPEKKPAAKKPAEKKPVEVPRDATPLPDQDAWRDYPMPWGNQAGVPLAELDKKYLFGLWANYRVETEYNGRPKRPETIEKDQTFRAMLDLAGQHYQFKLPEGQAAPPVKQAPAVPEEDPDFEQDDIPM